jgi:signal transduction histidine kinase
VRLDGLGEHDFSAWLGQRCLPDAPFVGVSALRAQAAKPSAVTQLVSLCGSGKRVLQVGLRSSTSSSVSQILYFRDVTHETEVDHMKSEFLATAAHELRTPMASIFGFSELLLSQPMEAAGQQEALGIIYSQSKLMSKILDELLDLARIEARRGKDFRYTRVCLQTLVADVVKAYPQPKYRSSPELRMPQEPSLYVMADQDKLRQVIMNVLSNAYKYSPAGGAVVIEIEAHHAAGRQPEVCIHISDSGIGMTPEQMGRVCDRFYRADTSGKTPGTGLGMSIAKEIIDLHRGQLILHSTPGRGSRITLCLPG